MSLVLDGSVALASCFDDEWTPAVDATMDQVTERGAIVPGVWPLEVLNGLFVAERRQRIDRAGRKRMAEFLRGLPIEVDPDTAELAWTVAARHAEHYRLTLYDAAYLELALRLGLPLATLDRDLRRAGERAGVQLLGL
jgi:predicted nucleic acid-binding protein